MSAGQASRGGDHDVFLSHNSRDKVVVERIAERLTRAGIRPWLDRWAMTPGGAWQHELGEGLESSSACAVFVGCHDLGDWELQEAAFAIDRAAKVRGFRVFPVLLPGVADPFDPNELPHFLRARTWVDFRKGVEDGRALQDLVNAIKGIPFGPSVAVQPRDDVCPYRGLEVFESEHAEFFFGRDREVQRLVEKLKQTRLLTVLGPSGSGKSSLVRAGLLPALRRGVVPEVSDWETCVLRPGAAPLTALAAALTELCGDRAMGRTVDELADDPRTLHFAIEYATRNADGRRVLCVIDQLEEVFTLCHDDAERQQLFANLLYAAAAPGGSAFVVLTMRADFYQRCAAYPELAQLLAANQFLASPMDAGELRQAIEEPARRVGLEFEEGLVAAILDDAGADPAALPLLEHALLELWRRRRGTMLTLEAYIETGGVSGAIAKRADEIFAGFSDDEQWLARRLLLRLTQPGEGTEDTRRRARLAELASADDSGGFDAVLSRLVDARLLTTGVDRGERSVDVAHEALIRGWPRLRGWIESDRAGLRVHRRLTDAVAEWQRLGRDDSVLYRGVRLDEALDWVQRSPDDLNDLEREFLDASATLRDRERREEQQRQERELHDAQALAAAQRRARRRVQWVAAALFIGVLAAGAAAIAAIQQRATADDQRRLAEARLLAARSAEQLAVDPELALLLASEAADRARTPEVKDALRHALQSPITASLRGHRSAIVDASFGRDRKHAVTVDEGGVVRIWDLRTATSINVRRTGGARTAQLSPNGKLVLMTSLAPDMRLASAVTGRAYKAPLAGHDAPVVDARFSPDGQRILSWSEDGRVVLWDVPTRRVQRVLVEGAKLRRRGPLIEPDAAFDAEGRRVATVGRHGLEVWDAASGRRAWRRAGAFQRVAFDPHGRRIVTTDSEFLDRAVRLWSAASGRPLQELAPHRGDDDLPLDAQFAADGSRVLTAGTVWDPARHRQRRISNVPKAFDYAEYYTNGREVTWEAASPDGGRIVSIESDRAEVRDATTGRRLSILRAGTSTMTAMAVGPDGRSVLTGHRDGSIQLWNPRITPLVTDGKLLAAVAVSPSGSRIAGLTERGEIRIWDAVSGRVTSRSAPLPGCTTGETFCSAFLKYSPDGRRLQVVYGSYAMVVDLAGALKIEKRFATDDSGSIALSADGRRVAINRFDDACRIRDVVTGDEISHMEVVNPGVALSPDGRLAATVSATGAGVGIWNATTAQRRGQLDDDRTDAEPFERSVAFSADGRRLIIGRTDGTAAIVSTDGGRRLALVTGHQGSVAGVGFSSDGRFVTTIGDDGSRVSDAASGHTVAAFADAGAAAMTNDDRHVVTVDPRSAMIVGCEACADWAQLVERAEDRTLRDLSRAELGRYLGSSGG